MTKPVKRLGIAACSTGLYLLVATALPLGAQNGIPPLPTGQGPIHMIFDQYPAEPSRPPAFTIPVAPLGFSVPGNNYLLRKQSMVSLDFLDENRLLFTFHMASGLMTRDAGAASEENKHRIQGIVLRLPGGEIEAQATWVVPDHSRYLWMLNNGSFLLRVEDGLDQGDGKLTTKPYLHLPGKLLWIQLDPMQQVVITNSLEPAAESQATGASSPPSKGSTALREVSGKAAKQDLLVIRTIKRESGEVIHTSKVPWTHQTTDWPMNSEGYLEKVHGNGTWWSFKLNSYEGLERGLNGVESKCPPTYGFLSETELLMSVCDPDEGLKLEAMSLQGKSLWSQKEADNAIWPLLLLSSNSSRVARETMLLKRSVDHYKHFLSADDFQGQVVRVFDANDGKTLLEAPLTPIFDAGGNVAISPSGKRIAILNAGAIQVFELPPAAAARH